MDEVKTEVTQGESPKTVRSRSRTRTIAVSYATVTIGLTALVLVSMLAFASGVHYQKAHDSKSLVTNAGMMGGFGAGPRGGFARNGGAFGTVTAVDDSSVTVKNDRTGADTKYTITASTTITQDGVTKKAADIQVGDTLMVRVSGSASTTAVSININPPFGPGMGGPGGGTQSSADGTI